jgi:hypothetical protein
MADRFDGIARKPPEHTCSATVACGGKARQCRTPVRVKGAFCKKHEGHTLPPPSPCPRCAARAWQPARGTQPRSIEWRGSRYVCALCAATERAAAAEQALRDTLAYTETVLPGTGALNDVCQYIRQRLNP